MSADNGVVTVDILGPAHGGSSVARVDGQVVFVRGALPGEKGVPVRIDATTTSRRYLTGEVADVHAIGQPSGHRVAPACPAAAAGAGCCDLDVTDATGSLEFKTRVVREQFVRIGRIDLDATPLSSFSALSPEPFTGYRTRVRLGVDEAGRAGLRRRNSNGIVVLDDGHGCAQWAPALADGLAAHLSDCVLTPGAEVCVAIGDDGSRSVVEVPAERRQKRHKKQKNQKQRAHRVRRRVLSGTGQVTRTVAGVTWQVPVESFWQAHVSVAELYADWVTAAATRAVAGDGAVAWDLYGGAGVFAAALTSAAPNLEVECVDIASASTAAGRDALAGRRVRFVEADVADTVGSLAGAGGDQGSPSVVVIDPPRTGAGDRVIDDISSRSPGVVLHVGCDPATAARDAAAFVRNGYRPDSVTVVDAFGLTHHVEVLVRYVRDTGKDMGKGTEKGTEKDTKTTVR